LKATVIDLGGELQLLDVIVCPARQDRENIGEKADDVKASRGAPQNTDADGVALSKIWETRSGQPELRRAHLKSKSRR